MNFPITGNATAVDSDPEWAKAIAIGRANSHFESQRATFRCPAACSTFVQLQGPNVTPFDPEEHWDGRYSVTALVSGLFVCL